MALTVNLSSLAANGGAPLSYSAGTTYVVGDVVTSGGVKFKCKATSTGNTPATGANTYWVEIVERTIGNATRDYQTIASWLVACPNLTTTNQIWKGLIYKEGNGATEWAEAVTLDNKNTITDGDRFVWLEAASGQSFVDSANVRSNALVYNNANGVSISKGTDFVYGADRGGYSFLRGLQIKGWFGISNVTTYLNISQCLIEWQGTSTSFVPTEFGSLRAVNCAFRSGQTSGTFMSSHTGDFHCTNCTFLGSGGTVFYGNSGNTIVLKNSAFFGFSAIATSPSTQIDAGASTYNATDLASFGYTGTGNVTGLTVSAQFESVTSPFDLRVKAGAGLNVGTRIQPETADVDISRFARSTTTPTVGAWEFGGVSYSYARPASDITTQWTPSSGTVHWSLIDETVADDTDYIVATASGQVDEVKLASMSTPSAGSDISVNYKVAGITGGATVTVRLVCGTTVIATDTARSANGTYTLTVPSSTWSTGATQVTDWTNMRLRFTSA